MALSGKIKRIMEAKNKQQWTGEETRYFLLCFALLLTFYATTIHKEFWSVHELLNIKFFQMNQHHGGCGIIPK